MYTLRTCMDLWTQVWAAVCAAVYDLLLMHSCQCVRAGMCCAAIVRGVEADVASMVMGRRMQPAASSCLCRHRFVLTRVPGWPGVRGLFAFPAVCRMNGAIVTLRWQRVSSDTLACIVHVVTVTNGCMGVSLTAPLDNCNELSSGEIMRLQSCPRLLLQATCGLVCRQGWGETWVVDETMGVPCTQGGLAWHIAAPNPPPGACRTPCCH